MSLTHMHTQKNIKESQLSCTTFRLIILHIINIPHHELSTLSKREQAIMKYSWFINLTTEKQTMATRGVWHPLLPNTEVSNTTVSATRSALQQEAAIRRRRRADIQVNVVIPTHNFCSLVFVFFKNLCLTEIRWKGNVAGFLHLAQISYCLSLCGALSTMCQTPRCFEFKKKKDEEGEKYPMKMKLWQGDKSHHCFSSVLLEDRSRRGGRKRKMKITRVKGEKVRMESKTETTRVGRGMQEGQRPASLPISPSQPLMLPR